MRTPFDDVTSVHGNGQEQKQAEKPRLKGAALVEQEYDAVSADLVSRYAGLTRGVVAEGCREVGTELGVASVTTASPSHVHTYGVAPFNSCLQHATVCAPMNGALVITALPQLSFFSTKITD